LAGLLNRCTG